MQDRLKDFMEEHREAFDAETPPTAIWDKIDDQLPQKQSAPIRRLVIRYAKIAAAVFILFGVGMLTGSYLSGNETEFSAETQQEINDLNTFYSRQVNEKLNELKSFSPDNNVIEDIKELDSSFQALKDELGNEVNDHQVIEAMIREYQTKIEILDRVIVRMKSTNKSPKSKKL